MYYTRFYSLFLLFEENKKKKKKIRKWLRFRDAIFKFLRTLNRAVNPWSLRKLFYCHFLEKYLTINYGDLGIFLREREREVEQYKYLSTFLQFKRLVDEARKGKSINLLV